MATQAKNGRCFPWQKKNIPKIPDTQEIQSMLPEYQAVSIQSATTSQATQSTQPPPPTASAPWLRWGAVVATPLLLSPILFLSSQAGGRCGYVVLLMAVYW